MRISCILTDPGYSPLAGEAVEAVTVDGIDIDDVLTVDDRIGVVKYWRRNEHGTLIVNNGMAELGTLCGVVVIYLKKGFDPMILTGIQ